MPSRTLNRSRQVGFLSVPSGPRDTTSFIDDIGATATGTEGGSLTNKSKYQAFITGADLTYFSGSPGKLLRYIDNKIVYADPEIICPVATARSNGWLVHTAAGAEIPDGFAFSTDISDVNYQNDCKSRILSYLSSHPSVRGIFIDGFQPYWNYSLAAYPIYKSDNTTVVWSKDSEYRTAYLSLAANTFKAVKDAGYQVYGNAKSYISGTRATDIGAASDIGIWQDSDNGVNSKNWMDLYYPYVTGGMIEYYHNRVDTHAVEMLQESPDFGFYNHWDEWQDVHRHAKSLGIAFWPNSYIASSEVAQTLYLRSSFLMEWDGGEASTLMFNEWSAGDIWNTSMALDPGQPQSAKVSLNSGKGYKRQYEHYLIYINPSQSTQVLDGHSLASGTALWL